MFVSLVLLVFLSLFVHHRNKLKQQHQRQHIFLCCCDFGLKSIYRIYVFHLCGEWIYKYSEEKNQCCRFFAININLLILGDTYGTKYGDALSSRFLSAVNSISNFMISYLFKSFRSKSSTFGNSSQRKRRRWWKKNHKIKWIGLYFEINFKIINNTSFTSVERS